MLLVRRFSRWLAAGLLLTVVGTVATAEPLQLGVHTENIRALRGEPDRRAQLAELGAQVIRLPVTWHLMEEQRKGVTPTWFWQELDAEVAAAEALGAQLILTFSQTPCWASSDPKRDCKGNKPRWDLLYPPRRAQDYADALGRLAARYAGRVLAYEVWNEPNLVWFWHGRPARRAPGSNDEYGSFVSLKGAADYARLVVAAAPALRSADPAARLLAGSIAGGDTEYLQALYGAPGFRSALDALSMHPYTSEYPGDNPTGARFGPNECPAGAMPFWCAAQGVQAMRALMVSQGDAAREIWFTEFGFSSSHYWNGSNSQPPGRWDSETGQARYLSEMVALIRTWPHVPVACWYELRDTAPHEPRLPDGYEGEREAHYGLYLSDGLTLKLAGRAFQAEVAGRSLVLPHRP